MVECEGEARLEKVLLQGLLGAVPKNVETILMDVTWEESEGGGRESRGDCGFDPVLGVGTAPISRQTGKNLSVKVTLEERCLRVL